MAKNKQTASEGEQRQSRKEILQSRKEREQKRTIYIAAGIVGGFLAIILLIAVINELIISPNRAVAEVADTEIALRDWQGRVEFERTQRIVLLESQLEAFGDVSLIQQFYGQVINELLEPELMGQTVLNEMVDDEIVLQAAAARGIVVTEAEIDEAIGESFNYFGGQSPTPFPTPTQTVMPTPSITPLPTAVITEVVPVDPPVPSPTAGPTQTPAPSPTPKSAEAFADEFDELLTQYGEYGVSEAQYRDFIRIQLYREKLANDLAEELNLPTAGEHASFLYLAFGMEESANEAQARIEADGFIPIWNETRSLPPEGSEEQVQASEILWRTREELEGAVGEAIATEAMSMALDTPSGVLIQVIDEETNVYYIIFVTGREVRELTESAIEQGKSQALTNFIDSQLTGNLTFTEFEQGRVPELPRLDPVFYTVQPTEPAPAPLIDPDATEP